MPVKIKNAPAPNFETLVAHLEGVQPDPNDHSAHIPHQVLHLESDALLAGKGLEAATLVAWRYIFHGGDGRYHVAEIGADEANDAHAFHHINMGSHTNGFVALYDRIHEHGSVKEKDYEIHLLRCPSAFVQAVWLKGEDHDHEFVVPLAPVHQAFEAGKTYPVDEFVAQLQAVVHEMRYTHASAFVEPEPVEEQLAPDDLTVIEGIGPKIAALLQQAGYRTFWDLAETTAEAIEAVMAKAGSTFNFHDASTWPEQANLAAWGQWKELEELQEKLKGGKR